MLRTTLLLLVLPVFLHAQPGVIQTFAGSNISGYSGDGGMSTAARFSAPGNVCTDSKGNVYVSDAGNHCIRKIALSGVISTVAGTGTSGYAGDGGPATLAKLNSPFGIATDAGGNLYIADANNHRVRKVSISGTITTIAGNGGSGRSGDGGPATGAMVLCPQALTIDAVGNLYLFDYSYVIRRINTTGIIEQIAGDGHFGYSGDGGPAMKASIGAIAAIARDNAGNVYLADRDNHCVRMVNTSGIISTFAGTGVPGYSGDGGYATAATLSAPCGLAFDTLGNLYVSDRDSSIIRKIRPNGKIFTVAGTGKKGYSGDGGMAFLAKMDSNCGIAFDALGGLMIAEQQNHTIRRVQMGSIMAGGFTVSVVRRCEGPDLDFFTSAYRAGMYVKTYFGDGSVDSSLVLKAVVGGGGYLNITHSYKISGLFSIKSVLYDEDKPVDSATNKYPYTFCRTLPVRLFSDINANGLKESGESFNSVPSLVQVDSNGITIGKISATGGFDYNAYAPQGTQYTFRLTDLGDKIVTTPAAGIIKDTVSEPNQAEKFFGMRCNSLLGYDVFVHATVPVTGVVDQMGRIYAGNERCQPQSGQITLYFSPNWWFDTKAAMPPAKMVGDNSAVWDISDLTNEDATPRTLSYMLWTKPGIKLMPRDTVHSTYIITPNEGDIDPSNNVVHRVDTVKAGCDPNMIEVSPAGCIPAEVKTLRYTIHFENTGNDTAHNIYVMDTLSNALDPATVKIVMASANMNVGLLKDGGYNILRFDFPDIKLLDSSYHGLCDGAVMYDIDIRKGLPMGTVFANHAGIFFDRNDVVMTNVVNSSIGCPALALKNVTQSSIAINPNPTSGEIVVTSDADYEQLTIANSMGQVVLRSEIIARRQSIDVRALTPGIYYVTLLGKGDIATQKLVVQ